MRQNKHLRTKSSNTQEPYRTFEDFRLKIFKGQLVQTRLTNKLGQTTSGGHTRRRLQSFILRLANSICDIFDLAFTFLSRAQIIIHQWFFYIWNDRLV